MTPPPSPERHTARPANAAAMRKPNLFVIGAMKSGTTFLSRLLDSHPSIFMAQPEEPSYFVPQQQLRKLWPYMWDQGLWRSEENYLALFRPGEGAMILGEASTNYSKLPLIAGVPERIGRFTEDAKFVYVMRDPVERTISHYWHMVRFHGEHRPMQAAVMADQQLREVSHYAAQLASYIAVFGRDRVFTLTYEELTRQTGTTMRRLYGWLGADPEVGLRSLVAEAENVTPKIIEQATFFGMAQKLRQTRPMRVITPLIPRVVRRAAKRVTTVRRHRLSADTEAVIRFLRPIQRQQTQELTAMLGRAFPEWTTLYGGPHT